MEWLVKTDGTQYPWVKENLAWGLGYFTLTKGHESIKKEWQTPVEISSDGRQVTYREGDIQVQVVRTFKDGDLMEKYIFTNYGKEPVSLYDMGIYTPLNDNYPGQRSLSMGVPACRCGMEKMRLMSMLFVWAVRLLIWEWWLRKVP